jgi:photosystem II stability/assembly factor-like uncharacterized protein
MMNNFYRAFLLSLCINAFPTFPQPNSNYPDSSIQRPDYRNHINIPQYDLSLMPLKTVRTGTGVWTELNPKVPRVDYLGIHFINKDTGWACGGNGAIIKTTNGGKNWRIAQTPTTTLLLKIYSYNGQVVIATGYDGIILRSSDGGENFSEVTSGVGSGKDLWGLQMINDTLGWISGTSAALIKTTDAGLSWQLVTPGLTQQYWSLDFLNESFGVIACGSGIVLITINGGSTWTQVQGGDTRSLYTIDVIDSLHIAAAGGPYGKNVYSSDGGATWIQNTDLIYENGVNCIAFVNADTGYAIGENWAINKTEDRGVTWWASDPVYAEWWLNLLPNGVGYAAGTALKIYKTSNGYDNWEKIFFTDNINDVFFINDNKGFVVVRDPAKLYRTLNGGVSWDSIPGAPGGVDLLFLDSLTGFIASDKIYKTTNGGNNWYQTNSLGLGAGKLFFITKQIGWATASNRILKSTDSGENWFLQITLPSDTYTSIFFIDSLNGWATSRYIWQTTNGGANWIQRTDIQILFSLDVFFKDYINGFAIASNEFYSTLNGGINWIINPVITGFSIAGKLAHYKGNPIFVIGYRTFRSIDGGINWFDYSELTGKRINGLSLLGMGLGYAAGELGLLLKYYDETVPVELTIFTAEIAGKNVMLNWVTATELNNKGFYVERKKDGELCWSTIAFIEGSGSSTMKNYYRFKDELLIPGKYNYRLKQTDYNGTYEYSSELEVKYISNFDLFLSHNYPNPFNPNTTIEYIIPERTFVKIILYDVTGREIKKIVEEEKEAGHHSVQLNLGGIGSGIYFYKMITGSGYTPVKKLSIIK